MLTGKIFISHASRHIGRHGAKGELESHREETFIDDIIQKSHIEKELLSHLNGIKTVFDGGAGCGRFSILLAKHGCKVTHFDILQPMIDKARELAKKEGVLDKIVFVKGALENLRDYKDNAFDMVISFDTPVSYTYPNQERVIGELIRICRKRIMISVSSRLGYLPYLANPIQKNQFILDTACDDPFVKWCIDNKENAVEAFHFNKNAVMKLWNDGLMGGDNEISEYENGGVPWCITYTFMPNELLVKIMKDTKQRSDFLEFCHCYDSNPFVCGMGKDNLFAQGEL